MGAIFSNDIEACTCDHKEAFEMEDGTKYCPTCDDIWITS